MNNGNIESGADLRQEQGSADTHRSAPVAQAIDLRDSKSNLAISDMRSASASPSLPAMELSTDGFLALLDDERKRKADGRPDLFDYVDKKAVKDLLGQPDKLIEKLGENFDKWDANHDGVLSPGELEDIVSGKQKTTTDQSEREIAAALRIGYHDFGKLDNLYGAKHDNVGTFLTKEDIDGYKLLYDEERQEKLFEQWFTDHADPIFDKVKNSDYLSQAFMYSLVYGYKYWGAFDDFQQGYTNQKENIKSLPDRIT